MKGLIIKPYWANKILDGDKTLEIRSSNINIRGTICVIISGTSKVWGTVELVDSFLIPDKDFEKFKDEHLIDCKREDIPYKKLYGWKLENPKKFDEPIKYEHKLGCVKWVNLDGLENKIKL